MNVSYEEEKIAGLVNTPATPLTPAAPDTPATPLTPATPDNSATPLMPEPSCSTIQAPASKRKLDAVGEVGLNIIHVTSIW